MRFLSREEIRVLSLLEEAGYEAAQVKRRSARTYDLDIEGTSPGRMEIADRWEFSAWLPLLLIREFVQWTHPRVAELTRHREMVETGDWSGVRDSEAEDHWRILHMAVAGDLPLQNSLRARKLAPRTWSVVAHEPTRTLRTGLTHAEARRVLEFMASNDHAAVAASAVEQERP